jgi:hypothetical protein
MSRKRTITELSIKFVAFELGRAQRPLLVFIRLDLPFYIVKGGVLVVLTESDLLFQPEVELEDSAGVEILVGEENNVGFIIITTRNITLAAAYGLFIVALSADA